MKTIEKKATTTTEKGTVINMTVKVTRGWEKVTEHLYNDGWESDVEKMKEFNETTIVCEVRGQKYRGEFFTGMFVPTEYKRKGVYAIFANKIGMSERVYNELNTVIEAAIAEAETDESWIRLLAAREKARKEEEEYDEHVRGVENMMTLNGKTY